MLKESASYSVGYGRDSRRALPYPNPLWDNRSSNERPTTMPRTLFGKHATSAT